MFFPKVSTFPPISSPNLLALSAAKKIIRISPIAKKFIISQENRSIAPHQDNLENSKEAMESKTIPSFQGVTSLAGSFCTPSVWWIAAVLSLEVNPLTSAVIKISEILRAVTVTTGAKIIPITPFTLRYSSNHFIFTKSLKLALRMINGEATIYSRRTHTLAISTKANAISGKNSAMATSDLMIKTPEVPAADVMLVSVSCAKLSNEE